jgi:hypothetical protein
LFESSVHLSDAAFPEAPIREADLRYVLGAVREGQCCSVVAPSNMGKSLLLKSLSQDEVRLACASAQRNVPVTVFVDCLEAGDNEHAFYELLLRRTVDELEGCGAPPAAVGTMRAIHQEVLRTTTDLSVRSLFATSIRELDRWREVRLVVILDEFDDVFSGLLPWPLRQLRALRDALGDKLTYVTGTSRRLERLRSDAETHEFRELFHLHTLVLQPLSRVDSRRLVAHLAAKQASVPSDYQQELAVTLSGGHPGLLECLYSMASHGGLESVKMTNAEMVELTAQDPIQAECRQLWDELEGEERDGLLTFVSGGEGALEAAQRLALKSKGLLARAEDGVATIFSPLFEAFLRRELRRPRAMESGGVRCNLKTGQIWSDDREITLSLSEPQRRLVRLLYQSGGAICTHDQIAEQIWGVGEGVTPGAIYELVKRVRQKVEPDWREPSYVVTVPGEGYRLKLLE